MDGLICIMMEEMQAWFCMESELQESKSRCASSFWQQMRTPIKYSNATLFILATLATGVYKDMNPVGETTKLERKEG